MRSTINVSLNKISQDQGVYPRFNTDFKRVDLFVELMEAGDRFPPVKITKNGDGYILLDGNHRLEARKRLGKEKIPADVFDIPRRLWRLSAARFNGKSPMPLKSEEFKKVILNAWEIDKIQDTYEIARELGCSDRYVRKILQPIRKREREEREDKVRKMRNEGVSQREVSQRLDIPRKTIYRIEKRIEPGEEMGQNGTVPECTSSVLLEFPGNHVGQKALPGQLNEGSNKDNKNGRIDKEDDKKLNPEPLPGDIPDDVTDETNTTHGKPLELLGSGKEPFPDGALEDPDFPDWVSWKPGMKETHHVLDMIREKWSIDRISKRMDLSPVWIRNTAIAMLYIDHYGRDKSTPDEIAEMFQMDKVRVEYLFLLNMRFTALPPNRRALVIWLQDYPPNNQSGVFIDLMRREQIYTKCTDEGKKCPWEYQEGMPRPFEEMPKSVEDKFYAAADFVNEVADLVALGLFQEEKIEKGLLAEYNVLFIAMNNLQDAVRTKKYVTMYNDDAMRLEAYNYIHGEKKYAALG